eukprot:sb/3476873/
MFVCAAHLSDADNVKSIEMCNRALQTRNGLLIRYTPHPPITIQGYLTSPYLQDLNPSHISEPSDTSKQQYLGHVTDYQPIRDQYFLIRSVPDLVVYLTCLAVPDLSRQPPDNI